MTAATEACVHCGEGIPASTSVVDGAWRFCCRGCRGAWRLLHEAGLEGYYGFSERARTRPETEEASPSAYQEYDHPTFLALHTRPLAGGLREVELYVEGVHCASCVWLVERLPLVVAGALRAELDLPRARVRIVYDPATRPLSAIARALATLGYRPHPDRGGGREERRRIEDRAQLARIGIAGALAGNVMLVALALYAGWFGRIEPEYETYFRWISMSLTAPALLGPGRVFFASAVAALRARTLHMDVPIALALLAGFTRGAMNTLDGRGPIYFDGVAMLVFLLLVGRYLQQRAQRAAIESTEWSAALTPGVARLLDEDGAVCDVPTGALVPGMRVEVRHGDAIPADGTVVEGESSIDPSLLTGESRPVAIRPGQAAWAGTIVRGPRLVIRVERAGEETRLARLAREVEAGAARRAPLVRAADRLAGGFVAVVLALALATWLLWAPHDPVAAVDHAIAMLIVTCPCALALATPLAMTVALGRAARAGILVRGGDAIERLARPAVLVLDKTGTLTEGRLALACWSGDAETARAVRALESHARHPVAEALCVGLAPHAAAGRSPAPEARVGDVIVTPGGGVEGAVDGRRLVVGSPGFVRSRLAPVEAALEPPGAAECASGARTPVWVAVDGRVVAAAGCEDRLRPEASATLAALDRRGFAPRILSGDAAAVVAAVGEQLGIPPDARQGQASPEDKLAVLERLATAGPVVMVGDGVNDAAAMARASVGIGVRGGAEACLAAADVFLARPGLSGLVPLVDGSARTLKVIRRALAVSLLYNVLGAGLTLAGRIDPLVAAILMPASSLTVVLLAWGGRTFDPLPEFGP